MRLMIQPPSEEAEKVVDVLSRSAEDGYTVMSRTGLSRAELAVAVRELREGGFVKVKGDLADNNIGEAYLYLSTYAQELAALFE